MPLTPTADLAFRTRAHHALRAPLAPRALASDGRVSPRDELGRGLAPLERRLLAVVLGERARREPEFEHRHLALRALAEPQRDHRRADPRAHVHRAAGG